MTKRQPVRIGTAGWSVPRESAGDFPGEGTHLVRYSRGLNCAEINSSFYRPHKQSTWERWRDSVPAGFRFSVKAPRAITHDAALKCPPEVLLAFLKQVGALEAKLGPLLFQLPPSLEFDAKTAREFLAVLRKHFSRAVACEPRHPSWFGEEATAIMSEFRIARVAADPACVRDAAVPAGSSELVYFRLHGSPRRYYSSYEDKYLESLAEELRGIQKRRDVWCIFDNTASGAAIRNALQVNRLLATANDQR
jgi:uncharacterized protein YecE (DUF72 family)